MMVLIAVVLIVVMIMIEKDDLFSLSSSFRQALVHWNNIAAAQKLRQ